MNSNPGKRSLDDLLGLDPDPVLGQAAQYRLQQRLAEVRGAAEAKLDAALALDSVEAPEGLGGRVLKGVRADRAGSSPDVLVPVPAAGAPRRRWRPRLLLPIAAAAAAALTLWMMRGGELTRDAIPGADAANSSPLVADATADAPVVEPDVEVSDELLASLSLLENMDFVTDELDPFDADALFLFESEDQVLFDILISEGYDLDGVESSGIESDFTGGDLGDGGDGK